MVSGKRGINSFPSLLYTSFNTATAAHRTCSCFVIVCDIVQIFSNECGLVHDNALNRQQICICITVEPI